MKKEFTKLGIWEKQDVLINKHDELLMLHECTFDFALIRGELNIDWKEWEGAPFAVLADDTVDFHKGNISDVETWKLIIENDLWIPPYSAKESPLRFALSSEFRISTDVFDYLYSVNPDEDLKKNAFTWVETVNAAKWVYEHGGDINYNGLNTCTLVEYVRSFKNGAVSDFIEEKLREQSDKSSNK